MTPHKMCNSNQPCTFLDWLYFAIPILFIMAKKVKFWSTRYAGLFRIESDKN